MIHKVTHLYQRWVAMGETPMPLATEDWRYVQDILLPSEFALWKAMDLSDQQHSLGVARHFTKLFPLAERSEIAAALLHDVGKAVCVLHRNARALATLGTFGFAPFRWYRFHERNGARTLQHIGSDKRTVLLVAGRVQDDVAKALRVADNAVK
jgi:hypothetical protein